MKRIRRPLELALAAVLLSACGGGGGGGGGTTPAQNSPPVVARPNDNRAATVGSAFSTDASQGGATFSDPDGDPLTYSVSLSAANLGLSVTGTTISGTPHTAGAVSVTVTATDGRGGSAVNAFNIVISPVSPAALGRPNLPAGLLPYADADIALPAHFTRTGPGSLAGADNTPPGNPVTNAGATLGRVLFYDRRLSLNDTIACASCHQQARGFSDPARFSPGFRGETTARHSMGLANARYYNRGRFFWDERAASLEEQVLTPIQDGTEMGMSLADLEAKLAATDFYPALFRDAFGTTEVTRQRIALALAQFVRAMSSYRSKYDQAFVNGVPNFPAVLTAQEERGRQIYIGVGRCDGCHGTDAHISPNVFNNGLDATVTDVGAGGGRFKSPSLRNVAIRGPYMHDGRFAALRDVVEHYDHGVQDNPNLAPQLRDNTGAPRRLNLSEADKLALVAFLGTLTDTALIQDPKFSNPF
ncbi:MAG: hypothetical protein RL588_521 [Pseudomonadota bacterium]